MRFLLAIAMMSGGVAIIAALTGIYIRDELTAGAMIKEWWDFYFIASILLVAGYLLIKDRD